MQEQVVSSFLSFPNNCSSLEPRCQFLLLTPFPFYLSWSSVPLFILKLTLSVLLAAKQVGCTLLLALLLLFTWNFLSTVEVQVKRVDTFFLPSVTSATNHDKTAVWQSASNEIRFSLWWPLTFLAPTYCELLQWCSIPNTSLVLSWLSATAL